MSKPFQSFVGFRGTAALFEVGDKRSVRFWLLARNVRELEALVAHLLPLITDWDSTQAKKAILIEAKNLPAVKGRADCPQPAAAPNPEPTNPDEFQKTNPPESANPKNQE